MNRKSKFTIEPKIVLIICSILCIALIVISFKYKEELSPIKQSVGNVISPMQKGIQLVGSWISEQLDIIQTKQELLEENNRLKEELATTIYENKILQQEKYELDGLRKLYELDQKYADYPKVAARVISKDPGNWYNVFTIDKGTNDGFEVGMNVMAGNGLVGIITDVGKNHSKVRSIIDDKSNVFGMFLKTSDLCNVKGNLKLIDSGVIEVEIYDKDADVKDGYEVVTSHISDKFLEGILIGYISDITVNPANMSKTCYLTPVVDFDRLDTVLVITELKEKLE